MADTTLTWLQNWYLDQCNGGWEHEFGITIDTLDNPGWRVVISITQTELETRPFDRVEARRTEHDWCICWVGEAEVNRVSQIAFHIACGRENLIEGLRVFQAWATNER